MGKGSRVVGQKPEAVEDTLTELLRIGAQQLISQAVAAELAALMAQYAHETDDQGRAAVVRNGYLPECQVVTGLGLVSVHVPKVRSRTGEPDSKDDPRTVSRTLKHDPKNGLKTARLMPKNWSTGTLQRSLF